ncbi:MAG: hypothetical protein ACM3U1_08185 [Chloroflexota bacterium]
MRIVISIAFLICAALANSFAQATLRFHDGVTVNLSSVKVNGEDYCKLTSFTETLAKRNFPMELSALPGSFFIIVRNAERPETLQMSLPSAADASGQILLPLSATLLALEDANLLKVQLGRDVAVISSPGDNEWERLVREETFLPGAPSIPPREIATTKKEASAKPITPKDIQYIDQNTQTTNRPPVYLRPNSFNLPADLLRKELDSESIIKK